jgi:hypothetical protein
MDFSSQMDSRRVDKYEENRAEWKERKLISFAEILAEQR